MPQEHSPVELNSKLLTKHLLYFPRIGKNTANTFPIVWVTVNWEWLSEWQEEKMRFQTQFVELAPITQWTLVSHCEKYLHFARLGGATQSTRKESSNTGCWACTLSPPPLLQCIVLPWRTLKRLSQMSPFARETYFLYGRMEGTSAMGWGSFSSNGVCSSIVVGIDFDSTGEFVTDSPQFDLPTSPETEFGTWTKTYRCFSSYWQWKLKICFG